MPADLGDAEAAFDVVQDAANVLVWCASPDAVVEDDDGEVRPVLSPGLAELYRRAIEQAEAEYFELAIQTLRGVNPDFPIDRVFAELERAGWTGSLREFKLAVLEQAGREQVTAVTRGGGAGGRLLRRVFRGFLGPLNATLDSLDGIPGVGAIKELKDFVEGAQAASER